MVLWEDGGEGEEETGSVQRGKMWWEECVQRRPCEARVEGGLCEETWAVVWEEVVETGPGRWPGAGGSGRKPPPWCEAMCGGCNVLDHSV